MNVKHNKYRIIGTSGSGKSKFSKRLSEVLNIKSYDLDNIYWESNINGKRERADIEYANNKLKNILKNNSWIIEGVYHKKTNETFLNSDVIIVIKINKIKRIYRLIKREIYRRFNKYKPKSNFKDIINLIFWSLSYEKELNNFLENFDEKEKLHVLKNDIQINKFLDKLVK